MTIRTLLQGIGLGAGLMYLWDPDFGRRRRARVLDQWEHAKHCTEDFLDKAQRDLSNRASGVTAEACSMLHRDTADDRVITARVRSKLGRYCSHPRAIVVQSQNGHVALSGQVLADEAGKLLKAVCGVAGVKHVENRLEIYRQSGNIAALQEEGGHPPCEPYGFLQQNWSPATRAIGQLGGLSLMGQCLAHRRLSSALLGAVGLGLFLRASTNRSLGQLMGTQVGRQAICVQRSVTIHAPVEKVWDFLTDFQQLGRFLPNVKSVHDLGEGYYRWGLHLPGGQDLQIEQRVTQRVIEERLSWESVSSQPVSYCGTLTLQREAEDSTRVNIRFEYTPPGGVLGSALASIFAMDANSHFQQAVMRIKPFLETGNPPHDLHEVSSDNRLRDLDAGQAIQSVAGQSEQQSRVGQPEWVEGQPDRPVSIPSTQLPPGELSPTQIPPVHTQRQQSPNQPERGRLG